MKTLGILFLTLLLLVIPMMGQSVQTVQSDPQTGTLTNCGGSPNLQYNEKTRNLWGCTPGTGWHLLNSPGASPAGPFPNPQISNGSTFAGGNALWA